MTAYTGPLVSVVIPSYNHGRYLGRALQSVLDQTYTNWEVFVIDNHSTDDTNDVLSRFTDFRIAVVKIRNNGVIAASRNMGIRAARGKWVAFLDSDDWWAPDKLQVCLGEIHKEVDVVYHPLKIVTDKPRQFGFRSISSRQVKPPVLIDLLVKGNAIATSSAIVKTTLLRQVNGMSECPEMAAAEDYNTWLRIAKISNNFLYVRKVLGFYRRHNQGNSKNRNMFAPTKVACSDFLPLLSDGQLTKFNSNLSYANGRYLFIMGDVEKAKSCLNYCLLHGNLSIKLKALYMLMSITYHTDDNE